MQIKNIGKTISSCLVFGILALGMPGNKDTRAQSNNLIANPSVEEVLANTNLPQGWYKDYYGRNTRKFIYPVAGQDGEKGLFVELLKRTSGDAKWAFDDVLVRGGEKYVFSDFYKSNITSFIVIRYKMVGEIYRYVELAQVPRADTWTQMSANFTAPVNAKSVTVYHLIRDVGWITYDSFSLKVGGGVTPTPTPGVPTATPTPVPDPITPTPTPGVPTATPTPVPDPITPTPQPPTADNQIANPSLEISTSGVSPDKWFTGNWGDNLAVFTYPVGGFNSEKAAKVEISQYSSGDAKWYFEDVMVTGGMIYNFGDSYLATTQSHLVVRYTSESTGAYSYVTLATLDPVTDWTTINREITVPNDTKSLTIFHLISAVGSLTVDNFSMTMVTPPPAFAKGMVSLDFDDGWLSTYQNGIPILDSAGYKSTQYIITGYIENAPGYVTTSQVINMSASGHEIGSHSRTHADLTTLTSDQLDLEICGSRQDLIDLGLIPTTLAFPYGTWNQSVLDKVKSCGYSASRTALIEDGGFNFGNQDRYLLKTQSVEASTTLADIQSWINTAAESKTWLILVIHSVEGNGGQYDTAPSKLQSIVDYLKTSNVDVVTVSQGLAKL